MTRINSLSSESFRKLQADHDRLKQELSQVRQSVSRVARNTIGNQQQRWFPFTNTSNNDIPPFGTFVPVTSSDNDNVLPAGVKAVAGGVWPNSEWTPPRAVNSHNTVPAGTQGLCTFDFPALVAYSTTDGTPDLLGDNWGPKITGDYDSDPFRAVKHGLGLVSLGYTESDDDGGNKRMLVVPDNRDPALIATMSSYSLSASYAVLGSTSAWSNEQPLPGWLAETSGVFSIDDHPGDWDVFATLTGQFRVGYSDSPTDHYVECQIQANTGTGNDCRFGDLRNGVNGIRMWFSAQWRVEASASGTNSISFRAKDNSDATNQTFTQLEDLTLYLRPLLQGG